MESVVLPFSVPLHLQRLSMMIGASDTPARVISTSLLGHSSAAALSANVPMILLFPWMTLSGRGEGTGFGRTSGQDMPPVVLILEARKEVADALESAIALADVTPVVVPHIECLGDVPYTPAAIVVRIAFESVSEPPHAAIGRLGRERPPVVAIVREENEAAEARRLRCDVVLRAPDDIPRLCEAVLTVIRG
jgi:hypothetical protein